ncbi:tail fiber assembly protein [Citrobacter freundii]|uniref:tail fiber assembly protein n=1 Tax=Citrobacter freundii TaxID=546 RepID=UPI00222E815E|nr:tail fiber assembly protein [Citrobacter freundii]BDT22506.1 hypothetical protein CF204P1_12290 [Citrobacter freundii]
MEYLYANGYFYPVALKNEYENSGNWPDGGIVVNDDIFIKYSHNPPADKALGTDSSGMPIWIDVSKSPAQ